MPQRNHTLEFGAGVVLTKGEWRWIRLAGNLRLLLGVIITFSEELGSSWKAISRPGNKVGCVAERIAAFDADLWRCARNGANQDILLFFSAVEELYYKKSVLSKTMKLKYV